MKIARVSGGMVINIEEWPDGTVLSDGMVEFTDDNHAFMGLGYDAQTGKFEQPAVNTNTPEEIEELRQWEAKLEGVIRGLAAR